MTRECQRVRVTETADGFRLDITGKDLESALACFFPSGAGKKKGGSGCRPPDKKEEVEIPYPIEALIEPIIRRMQ